MSSSITIDDSRAASVFAQSHLRRTLLQFARQPRSIAEVAAELRIDIKQLHHRVKRFLTLGLLVVIEERKRSGRPIRLYQAAAQRFFIPANESVQFSQGLAKELRESIARDAAISVQGMEFSLDDDGRVFGQMIVRQNASFVPMDSWRILKLSPASAAKLKQAMVQVLDCFQDEADTGGQVYLVHAGMARRPEHSGAVDNRSSKAGVMQPSCDLATRATGLVKR